MDKSLTIRSVFMGEVVPQKPNGPECYQYFDEGGDWLVKANYAETWLDDVVDDSGHKYGTYKIVMNRVMYLGTPESSCDISGRVHPHVNGFGAKCLGESHHLVHDLIADGQLVSAAAIIRSVLERPNWNNPLNHVHRPGRLPCTLCGKKHRWMRVCFQCYRRVGGGCGSPMCMYIGHTICKDCAKAMDEGQFRIYMNRYLCPKDAGGCYANECDVYGKILAWYEKVVPHG